MENDNLNNNNSLPSTSFSKKFKRLDLSLMSKLLSSFSNGKLSSVNSISISLISRASDSTGSASHYNENMLYSRFSSEPNKSVSHFKAHSGMPGFSYFNLLTACSRKTQKGSMRVTFTTETIPAMMQKAYLFSQC